MIIYNLYIIMLWNGQGVLGMDSNQALFLRTSKTAWFLEVSEAQILVAFCLATRHLERDIIMKWDMVAKSRTLSCKIWGGPSAKQSAQCGFNTTVLYNLVPACFFHESGWLNYEIFFSATVCWTRFVISFCLPSRCYGYKTTQKKTSSFPQRNLSNIIRYRCSFNYVVLALYWQITWSYMLLDMSCKNFAFWPRKKCTRFRRDQLSLSQN